MNIIHSLQELLKPLNNSLYFGGLMMLFLNIGSKYISIKLSPTQEALLNSEIAKQILVFTIAWIGTRDIVYSFILTAVFYILVFQLFNEESKVCILPNRVKKIIDLDNDGEISQQELNHAIDILNKSNKKKEREQYVQLMNSYNLS